MTGSTIIRKIYTVSLSLETKENNQDIWESQVTIINMGEKNPRVISIEGHNSDEKSSSVKEWQESSSNLILKSFLKSKKERITKNLPRSHITPSEEKEIW